MSDDRRHWWQRITRDLILFLLGIGLAVNELVIRDGGERPFTLAFIAALLGTPFVLRYDEARRASRSTPPPPTQGEAASQ